MLAMIRNFSLPPLTHYKYYTVNALQCKNITLYSVKRTQQIFWTIILFANKKPIYIQMTIIQSFYLKFSILKNLQTINMIIDIWLKWTTDYKHHRNDNVTQSQRLHQVIMQKLVGLEILTTANKWRDTS